MKRSITSSACVTGSDISIKNLYLTQGGVKAPVALEVSGSSGYKYSGLGRKKITPHQHSTKSPLKQRMESGKKENQGNRLIYDLYILVFTPPPSAVNPAQFLFL